MSLHFYVFPLLLSPLFLSHRKSNILYLGGAELKFVKVSKGNVSLSLYFSFFLSLTDFSSSSYVFFLPIFFSFSVFLRVVPDIRPFCLSDRIYGFICLIYGRKLRQVLLKIQDVYFFLLFSRIYCCPISRISGYPVSRISGQTAFDKTLVFLYLTDCV